MTTASEHNAPLRPAWVRWLTSGALLFSATLFLAALVVAIYNVRYSYHRIWQLASGDAGKADDVAALGIAEWVAPFLQDLSVISPGLVVFTSACMAFSALLLLWFPASAQRFSSPHFPFPPSYKTYYIQLGLLGTMIGFVIAFSDIDLSAERQSLVLVEALGTALWSTLTAILLAYGACPVVEMGYQRLRQPGARGATNTRSALETLRQRTVDAATSLATLTDSATALGAELSTRHIEHRVGRLEGTLSQVADQLTQLTQVTQRLSTSQEGLAQQARTADGRATAADDRLASLHTQLRELGNTLTGIGTAVEELRSAAVPQRDKVDALEGRLTTIVQTLKKAVE
jgi:hypothetical protein